MNIFTPTDRHHAIVKWGGATALALVILLTGLAINRVSGHDRVEDPNGSAPRATPRTAATVKPEPSSIVSAPPAVINGSAELDAASNGLDKANVDSTAAGLDQNDSELSAF